MKNKINYCSDIDLSKINLNCCDNEIVSIKESGPIESHFFDAFLYCMQERVREGLIKRMGVDYGLYNPSVQVELFVNPKEISHE
ncbi:hypothetical protein ABE425_14665 [Chryseobacterium cucumeris]|uniref:hypothetical protein n=1 Tax=Chryseobacterium cucumeris TaxID=1813611 RepID=UPI0032080AD1